MFEGLGPERFKEPSPTCSPFSSRFSAAEIKRAKDQMAAEQSQIRSLVGRVTNGAAQGSERIKEPVPTCQPFPIRFSVAEIKRATEQMLVEQEKKSLVAKVASRMTNSIMTQTHTHAEDVPATSLAVRIADSSLHSSGDVARDAELALKKSDA